MEALINAAPWAVAGLMFLGWVTRELIPRILERRKGIMEERHADEERIVAPYREQIARLERDIHRLDGILTSANERHESEMHILRGEHLECVRNHSALEARVELLQTEIFSLRQWRHDLLDKQHTDAMAAAEKKSHDAT
jgi:hypothetical protein